MSNTQNPNENLIDEMEELRRDYDKLKEKYMKEMVEGINVGHTLSERESYLRSILQTTQDGFWVVSKTGIISDVNDSYCRMSGYSRSEIIGMKISDLDAEDTPEETKASIERIMANGSEIFETKHKRKDGSIFTVEISVSYQKENGDKICFCRDVTERKLQQEALKKSENRYKRLIEGLPDIVYIYNRGKGAVYWSEQVVKILGISQDELKSNPLKWTNQIHKEDVEKVKTTLNNIKENETFNLEYRIYDINGNIHWFHDRAFNIEEINGELIIEGVASDITERKLAEEYLAKQKEIMIQAEQLAELGAWEWDILNDSWIFTENWLNIHGCVNSQLSSSQLILIAHPEDRHAIEEAFNRAKNGEPYEIQHRIIRQDSGEIRYVNAKGLTMFDVAGKLKALVGVVQDITNRKKAEQALKESEEQYRLLSENISDGVVLIEDDKIKYISPCYAKMLGQNVEDIKKIKLDKIFSFIHPEDQERIKNELYEAHKKQKEYFRYEYRAQKSNGEYIWIEDSLNSEYDENGNRIRTIIRARDITERKQMEEELQESQARYKSLFEASPDAVLLADRSTGIIIDANYTAEKLFETTIDNIIGKHQLQLHPEPQHQKALKSFKNRPENENQPATPVDIDIVTALNTTKNVEIRGTIIDLKGKELVLGTFRDITERKKLEESLQESLARFNELVASIPIGIYIVWMRENIHMRFKYVSNRWCDIFKLSREDVLADAAVVNDLVHPDDREGFLERNIKAAHYHEPFLWEGRFITGDGELHWLRIESTPTVLDNGDSRWFGIVQDITERKQAEEKLEQQNLFISTLLDNLKVGVVACDANENLTYFNKATQIFHGLPQKNINAEHWADYYDLYLPDEKTKMQKKDVPLFRALEGEQFNNVEMIIFPKHAKPSTYVASGTPIFDKNGKKQGAVVSMYDITGRKLAEEALKESEEKYKALFDFLPFGVSLTDKHGNLVENNEKAKRLLCLSKEELLKRQISGEVWNIIRPDGSLMPADEYASVIALKENRRAENVSGIVKNNNDTTWITITAEPFRYGDYGVVISYLDITKMVLAEKELKQNEERLKTIVNILQSKTESVQEFLDYALNKAVEFTDSKLGYIYFYDEEKKEFILNSWSNEVMRECSITKKRTRYDLDRTGIWGEAVRQRKPIVVNDFQASNPLKKGYPEGHAHLENFLTVPIFVKDEIVAVVGVANKATNYNETDVLQLTLLMDTVWRAVERKQEEDIRTTLFEEVKAAKEDLEALLFQKNSLLDELSESEAKLIQSLATKDKFFSIIAHDLRSPFSGFLGLTSIMAKGAEELTLNEIKLMSNTINDSANSIYKLLNDLLLWSRTQIGTIPFNKEELDLYEIAFNTVYLLKQNAQDKKITLEHNIKPDTIFLCDRNMIVTIFRNLVTNSIKFCKHGGKIEIGIIKKEDTDDDQSVMFFVKDNGIGIPKEHIEDIFSVGHDLTRKGTDNESGTGLGLVLCKEFVEKHGGRIWCESEVGKGSTFYFTLPRR